MLRKVFVGVAAAGVLAGALATGAFAAPAGAPAASPQAKHHSAKRDVFRGTVSAISDSQLTVRSRNGESKTFLRTDKTEVFRGRDRASWSEIEVNSHVAVRYEERDGKLYAKRIRLGLAHVAGKVESVNGNLITIRSKDGKDIRVTVTADTKYFEGRKGDRKPGSLKDIQAGDRLLAAGKWDSNGSFDAAVVLTSSKNGR